MKLSLMGRVAMATLASLALGLGMSACGGGTIGYMWVLGDQFNQITGYKIDDFSGNLTQVIGSPFSANGTNPVSIIVKPGGRYVYVINQGTGGKRLSQGPNGTLLGKEVSGGIAVYAVGGDGILTYQQTYQTQGSTPVWAQFDVTGTYLYVLDKYSPDPKQFATPSVTGSITAFSTDGDTGRLTLVTNTAILDGSGNPTTFFNVGVAPTMMKTAGSCLFTLDSQDSSVFPYAFGNNGQLTLTTTGTIPTLANNVTSINGGGSNVFLTAAGSNMILPYTVGTNCNLVIATGGAVPNIVGTANPMYSMVDTAGKYLYVLNQSDTVLNGGTTTPFSSISAFVISPQLTRIPSSPYIVGSNPVCMVEDPSGQYVYVSNRNDGTVTGLGYNPNTGELSSLKRGSTFTASGLGSCLAVGPAD